MAVAKKYVVMSARLAPKWSRVDIKREVLAECKTRGEAELLLDLFGNNVDKRMKIAVYIIEEDW